MRKIIIVALATLLCNAAVAQQPDAVYKLLRQEWTVNADGTSDYHYRHEVQILRNRALVAYADKGETFVVYNPDLEELTINEVYTIQKDGTRIDMPQNAFIYQLPSQCADCGRFNHIRELAMVHTGMELGCTIVVDYTIHRRYNLVSQTVDLVRECPVERLEVSVKVPAGQELNVKLNDPEVFVFKPTIEQTATSYSLKAFNMPQTVVESYMPTWDELYPSVRFFNGTPEFVPAFDNNGLKEAEVAAYQQMQGESELEDVTAVRDFVVDNIHLNKLDPAMLGYVHSTAAEVWQTGCGTATDKAVLLAAMLNQTGHQARVIGDQMDEVGVMIDTLEYRLGVRYKRPAVLYGEAKDEVKTVSLTGTYEAELEPLEDGFYHFMLPAIEGSPSVRASNMALVRTFPLQGAACDLQTDVTYLLPKGMKMVGKAVAQKLAFEGVGSLEISIKQSGNKLCVVRNLKLEKSIVPVSDYANYRQLISTWQSVDKVLLRSK